jgi:hypothetical protein
VAIRISRPRRFPDYDLTVYGWHRAKWNDLLLRRHSEDSKPGKCVFEYRRRSRTLHCLFPQEPLHPDPGWGCTNVTCSSRIRVCDDLRAPAVPAWLRTFTKQTWSSWLGLFRSGHKEFFRPSSKSGCGRPRIRGVVIHFMVRELLLTLTETSCGSHPRYVAFSYLLLQR